MAAGSRKQTARSFPARAPFGVDEVREVTAALVSQNLFSLGGMRVRELEKRFAKLYGRKFAVACTSGTAALHLAVAALDLEPGREIITAPVTDFGTVAGMIFQGLVPVFADWKPGTFNMDPASVRERITSRTAAIVPVHLFGNPCDMDEIMQVASEHGLPVIEDCAQSYLTSYRDRLVGTIGDIGCFSMQQSKHLTAGEGGIVVTDDEELAMRMELFRDKGWESRGKWGPRAYAFLGLNYRMSELTGAVALAQLRKLRRVVGRRHELGEMLTGLLRGIEGVVPAPVTEGGLHSYWMYPMRVLGGKAERVAKQLLSWGLPCGWGYTGKPIYLCTEALHTQRTFGSSGYPFRSEFYDEEVNYEPGLCPVAEAELLQTITVYINENWRAANVRAAAEMIREALGSV